MRGGEIDVQQLSSFHHYSSATPGIRTPVERLEEEVVSLLLETAVGDEQRESSICFELKHSSAVTQFARLVARRRNLPPELCAAGGLLHDIHVIVDGGYADHAHKGAPIARKMAEEVGGFDDSELLSLESIVYNHSDKHLDSADPFAEFGKDIDVLDAFLYPGAFEWYLANKPLPVFRYYLARASRVWRELGVPADPGFGLLDDYEQEAWLDSSLTLVGERADLPPVATEDLPPFLLLEDGESRSVHFRRSSWRRATGLDDGNLERTVGAAGAQILPALGERPEGGAMIWPAIGKIEMLAPATAESRLSELLGERRAEVTGR